MMAADCLGSIIDVWVYLNFEIASYGSLARFRDVQRLTALGKTTLMGTSGDISDLQFTANMLKQYQIEEFCFDDGHEMNPKQWHTALAAYMYKKRSDMNPLWNSHILAGVDPKTGEM
jgi:20S proteasome subunit beta 7